MNGFAVTDNQDGTYRHVCQVCGAPTIKKFRLWWGKCNCKKRKEAPRCAHFTGQELRRETCPSCRGVVQVKVFQCGLAAIGEHTLEPKIAGVHSCRMCQRFAPAP